MTNTSVDTGFPSDQMLASQPVDRVSTSFIDVPERRLLVAVLADAARCLQIGGKPRAEVLVWVRGQKGAARLSFQFLCDGLGMEVALTARRLLKSATAGILFARRRVAVRSHRVRPLELPIPAQIPA
jgi:hypothetical protein